MVSFDRTDSGFCSQKGHAAVLCEPLHRQRSAPPLAGLVELHLRLPQVRDLLVRVVHRFEHLSSAGDHLTHRGATRGAGDPARPTRTAHTFICGRTASRQSTAAVPYTADLPHHTGYSHVLYKACEVTCTSRHAANCRRSTSRLSWEMRPRYSTCSRQHFGQEGRRQRCCTAFRMATIRTIVMQLARSWAQITIDEHNAG